MFYVKPNDEEKCSGMGIVVGNKDNSSAGMRLQQKQKMILSKGKQFLTMLYRGSFI